MTFPNFSFTNQGYTQGTGTTGMFWPVVSDRNPTPNDVYYGPLTYKVGQIWFNSVAETIWYLDSFSNAPTPSNLTGQLQALWIQVVTNTTQVLSLSDNANTQVFPTSISAMPPSNIQLTGQLNEQVGFFPTVVANQGNHSIEINPMSVARWIVDPLSTTAAPNGTSTTIGASLALASAGDTIFIMPGTYTENLTLKAGVNLSAFPCDALTPNVTIIGTCTMTVAGTSTLSGILLQTNGAEIIAVTGSAASSVNLKDCYLNCTNHTGITLSTSGGGAVTMYNCIGDIGFTGITLFTMSNNNGFTIFASRFTNSGNSTTASTASGGTCNFQQSEFNFPITTSGNNRIISFSCSYNCSNCNATSLTCGGSGANSSAGDYFSAGTALCLSIGGTLTITLATIVSSNNPALSGAGTINFGGLVFLTNSTNSVNTKNQLVVT